MPTFSPDNNNPLSGRSVLRPLALFVLLASAMAAGASVTGVPSRPDLVRSNSNAQPAGTLRNGVLTVTLEAKRSLWRFAATRPPMTVEAFAERGKPPLMPGPLLRVPAGTQLQLTIRNSLPVPLTFIVPAAIHGGPDRLAAMDSVVIAPGAADTFVTRAEVAGNYIYRGKTPDGVTKVSNIAGVLAGAIVVDTARATASTRPPHDRVFVIMATEDSVSAVCDDSATVNPLSECPGRRFLYTINGTQWPNSDRIHATVGDSLHWRVINASFQVHPMHLHGFYYRVDDLSGPVAADYGGATRGQMVVTQLLAPLSSMSMTWSPERRGNWLFHCHFALHNTSYPLLATPDDPDMRDMVGLVLGAIVAPRPGVVAAGTPAAVRHLRLIAERADAPNRRDSLPSMHFVLEEHGDRVDTRTDWSPEIDLVRGEPVSITIVNHLDEPTTVHWHGIEVEDSYMDGAGGFSGDGRHLAPIIAPGDSFVARFAPPRAGTFMYHAHFDEQRQELSGLEGALIVRDPGTPASPYDHTFFLKGDLKDPAHPVEIDGSSKPDTVVLHAGRAVRLRLVNLATSVATAVPSYSLTARPDSAATIGNDTMLVRWRSVAKDGWDLPVSERTLRSALQVVSVGETFDVEFTPQSQGALQLEVRATGGRHALQIRVPLRVEP
jgi:FtsP/CotA-like multicopper oxidase with cupredoxin domain